jgi:hypothetical protein
MHWIPLELHSQACFGESSTRMGDLLGSPRVAPLVLLFQLFFCCYYYYYFFCTDEGKALSGAHAVAT